MKSRAEHCNAKQRQCSSERATEWVEVPAAPQTDASRSDHPRPYTTLEQEEEEKEDTQVILSSSRKTLPYCTLEKICIWETKKCHVPALGQNRPHGISPSDCIWRVEVPTPTTPASRGQRSWQSFFPSSTIDKVVRVCACARARVYACMPCLLVCLPVSLVCLVCLSVYLSVSVYLCFCVSVCLCVLLVYCTSEAPKQCGGPLFETPNGGGGGEYDSSVHVSVPR